MKYGRMATGWDIHSLESIDYFIVLSLEQGIELSSSLLPADVVLDKEC